MMLKRLTPYKPPIQAVRLTITINRRFFMTHNLCVITFAQKGLLIKSKYCFSVSFIRELQHEIHEYIKNLHEQTVNILSKIVVL